jgi:hypothetical protein
MDDEVSLILDLKDENSFGEFVSKHISPLEQVEGVWLINLVKPRFLHVPRGTPMDYKRFVLTISAEPSAYEYIYKKIIGLRNEKHAIVTYVTYIFQPLGKDLQVSVISKDKDTINEFVEKDVMNINGVKDVDISPVSKTKKLVPNKEWLEHINPYINNVSVLEIEKETRDIDEDPWEYAEKFVCC